MTKRTLYTIIFGESNKTAYAVYGFFAATGSGTVSVVATKK